jgi:hypothetical protein
MACHPDLVLRSKSNIGGFLADNMAEATVCRLCNDIAEDAIQAKCRHIFDRECIKQYLNTAIEQTVRASCDIISSSVDSGSLNSLPALCATSRLPSTSKHPLST